MSGDLTVQAVDPALVEMMNAVFSDYRAAHPPRSVVERDPQLWATLDDLGLIRLTGPIDSGGSGAGWREAAELLSAAVRHGVHVPLAEHDLLACGVLDAVGHQGSDQMVRTVCVLDHRGVAANVPWAAGADRVVVLWPTDSGYRLADVDPDSLEITSGHNAIGEPRDTVSAGPGTRAGWFGVEVDAAALAQLHRKAALVRAIQVCAALEVILELSLSHTGTRRQFGRPLSKFQALQHLTADIACEAALARAATEAALGVAVAQGWGDPALDFRIAVARSCVGHAASVVVRNAHQIHGAIGTTREHRLHEFTRPALTWRSEFGSVRHWDRRVAEAAVTAGGDGLWPLITGA